MWSRSPEALARILGKTSPVAHLLLAARDASLEAMRSELLGHAIESSSPHLIKYLKASMGALPEEVLRVLFLDAARRLITDEQMSHGSVGQVTLYPRAIFRRALELDAAAIILVHNHPSGDPTPSGNDIRITDLLRDIGRTLDVELIDHVIVTEREQRRLVCGKAGPKAPTAPSFFRLGDGHRDRYDAHEKDIAALALANARRTLRRRLLRKQLLGNDELFGEPAWDMLIDLFIHESEAKPVSTSSLGIASGLGMSSALRLVQRLCDAELLVRTSDPSDGRRNFIRLAPEVAHRLTAYFAAGDE